MLSSFRYLSVYRGGNMKRNLVLGGIFLFGLGIFLYPTISNWLATRAHYSEISSYDKKIKALQKKEVERREKKQPNIINKFKLLRKHLQIHFLKKK